VSGNTTAVVCLYWPPFPGQTSTAGMRIRIVTFDPLPPLKAWFDVDLDNSSTIWDLKHAISTRVSALREARVTAEHLVLVIDDWELLTESRVGIVRDGEVVGIRGRDTEVQVQVQSTVGTDNKRKRAADDSNASDDPDDSSSSSDSTASDCSSDSDLSSPSPSPSRSAPQLSPAANSHSEVQDMSTRYLPVQLYPFILLRTQIFDDAVFILSLLPSCTFLHVLKSPDFAFLSLAAVSFVPSATYPTYNSDIIQPKHHSYPVAPGHGKLATHRRNLRRRLKRQCPTQGMVASSQKDFLGQSMLVCSPGTNPNPYSSFY